MTSPDPADPGRAPWHVLARDNGEVTLARTFIDGAVDVEGSLIPTPERGMSVDRLALALLLIAVFVAVPLGLLALQAA
jgi:hypothetical protein